MPTSASSESPTGGTPSPNAWEERIASFAAAVGKNPEEIVNALKPLVGDPGASALEALSDSAAVLIEDLQNVLVTNGPLIPLGIFRKHVDKLRGPRNISSDPIGTSSSTSSFDVLPPVPEDASFLEMLKVGGVLKPEKTEVIAAIRAGLAHKLGLFELPELIVGRIESFAESQDEPVVESFYKLRKLVVSRSYAEVLSVIGVEGSFVSEGRKKAFLARVDENLWMEVKSFYGQLTSWQESWMATAGNPSMALTMLAMAQSGGRSAPMPPGMLQPPETSAVRDAAEEVINKINRVFAGVGIPIARALAYDANRIKSVLEETTLPAAIGATNREQMLKMLGITVGADYVRLERSVTRFVLAIMELPKVSSGNEELSYLAAMITLGASIPWDKLPDGHTTPGRAGLGKRPPL